jgi:hypothetical protein
MNRPFTLVTPDRLQIREGGGCMAAFGVPFFAAGIFLCLTVLGIVPFNNADEVPTWAWPLFVLMAIAFTMVGGGLVFGRSWTTIDRAQREMIKQMGLIVPLYEQATPLHGYTAVRLGFVEGDSDTADSFPVALTGFAGPDLVLWNATVYEQGRDCARALGELLHFDIEDATTDNPVRLRADQMDVALRERLRSEPGRQADVSRPPGARSHVTRAGDAVTIVIPQQRINWLVAAAGLIPLGVLAVIGPSFATFFRQSRTPDPVAWIFMGFFTLGFGVLPMMTALNAFVRSRRGATIVDVSPQEVRIRERGAWRTTTTASFAASDILDIDYASREAVLASAKRAVEQQVLQSYPSYADTASPQVERWVARLTRFVSNKGLTIKTRSGRTMLGQGLDEEEIRYLHALLRRTLAEQMT